MQNILPIFMVGDRFIATSVTGMILSHVWRQNYGGGYNVADSVGSNASWYYHSVYGYLYVLIGSCYIDNIGIHVGAFSDAVDYSSSSECWGSMYDFLIYLYVCSYIANYYFREFSGGGGDYYACFQRRL